MERRRRIPALVDVLAQLLKDAGYQMCADRFVRASANLDSSWPEVASVRTDPFQRDAMKMKQMRKPEVKRTPLFKIILDNFEYGVDLSKAITRLSRRPLVRV